MERSYILNLILGCQILIQDLNDWSGFRDWFDFTLSLNAMFVIIPKLLPLAFEKSEVNV